MGHRGSHAGEVKESEEHGWLSARQARSEAVYSSRNRCRAAASFPPTLGYCSGLAQISTGSTSSDQRTGVLILRSSAIQARRQACKAGREVDSMSSCARSTLAIRVMVI